jgi:hypothetical protein
MKITGKNCHDPLIDRLKKEMDRLVHKKFDRMNNGRIFANTVRLSNGTRKWESQIANKGKKRK